MRTLPILALALGVPLLTALHSMAASESACAVTRYKAYAKYHRCQNRVDRSRDDAWLVGFFKCRRKYDLAYQRFSRRLTGTSCEGARFLDNGDGTVTDNLTRLVWESKSDLAGPNYVGNQYGWTNAGSGHADGTVFSDLLAGMNSTCYAGYCDWRVPTMYELQTILSPVSGEPCPSSPCVADPLLLPMNDSVYVSATERPGSNSGIGFDDGDGYSLPKTGGPRYYRVVRGGL